MAVIGWGISLRGLHHEEFHYPFYVSGDVSGADVGKAVALDTSAANTVKLASDGDQIIGQLATYEDRKVEGVRVGAVELHGGWRFQAANGADISVGDTVVGGGGGTVKAADTPNHAINFVAEVDGTNIIIVR